MKLEAQRFVAGKLILMQTLPELLFPQPGYVYGRELIVAAMKYKISCFAVLPRPPLDGPDRKH